MRQDRYASFDSANGKAYENGTLTLKDLRALAVKAGAPKQVSGKQEVYEQLVSMYV